MKTTTTRTIRHRRKREGKTNYKKRLELLKGRKNRLVVRKTNSQFIIQIVKHHEDGDKVIQTTESKELTKLGWKHNLKNTPTAYLTGILAGKKAKENKIKEAILDLGLQTPRKNSKLYAIIKGAKESGLNIPVNEEIYPSEDRIQGKHIAQHEEKHKTITEDLQQIKQKILK